MKSVLISIQPKWVEKICHEIGKEKEKPIYEKVVEVRKSRPKLETPFKCYIYCTKVKEVFYTGKALIWGQEVIGEFVCDRVYDIPFTKPFLYYGKKMFHSNSCCKKACLSYLELENYLGNKDGYAWHISDLKIYDKPKELSEFYIYDRDKHRPSVDCEHKKAGYSHDWCLQMEGHFCNECLCDKKRLTRPPQSWCYVESLGE